MTETEQAPQADPSRGATAHSRGAHALLVLLVFAVFLVVVGVVGSFGWFVVASIWSDEPDAASVVFASGVVLAVLGSVLVAMSSLVSVLHRLDALGSGRGSEFFERWRGSGWTAGVLCALVGLLVLVGLGVVMVLFSHLPVRGKVVVVALFAVCSLIPLAPGYEIWGRFVAARARGASAGPGSAARGSDRA